MVSCRYVGLKNLGNSCYMNSVLQMLWTLPEVQQRYATAANSIFLSAPADPTADLPSQVSCPTCQKCSMRYRLSHTSLTQLARASYGNPSRQAARSLVVHLCRWQRWAWPWSMAAPAVRQLLLQRQAPRLTANVM